MATLEYSSDITGPQVRTYGSVHRCKKCGYFTKSIFFMRNHVRRHKLQPQPQKFDCQRNDIEEFYCKECHYITFCTSYFNHHIKFHHSINGGKVPKKLPATSYKCTNSFETYSSLVWLKNEINHHSDWNKVEEENEEKLGEASRVDDGSDDPGKVPVKNTKKPTTRCSKPKEKSLKCDQCPFAARFRSQLIRHKMSHVPWIKCKKCTYKTRVKDDLRKHIQKHLPQLMKCPWCDVKTKYRHLLETHIFFRHKRNNNGSAKWLKCDQCKTYKTLFKDSLVLHRRTEHGIVNNQLIKCPRCDFKAKNQYSLDRHNASKHKAPTKTQVSLKDQLLKCPNCDFQTKRQHSLDTHVHFKHKTVATKPRKINGLVKDMKDKNQLLKCPHCDLTTRLQHNIDTHIRAKHQKNASKPKKQVNKRKQAKKLTVSKTKVELLKNGRRSKAAVVLTCQKCICQFETVEALEQHVLKLHMMSSPVVEIPKMPTFEVIQCGNYKVQVPLKDALKEQVVYDCDRCPYKTHRDIDLKIHVKLAHADISTLTCDVCLFTYKSVSCLVRHMKEKHCSEDEIEWFLCSRCPYRAKRKDQLRAHLRRTHH